jgi:hypothetical protein
MKLRSRRVIAVAGAVAGATAVLISVVALASVSVASSARPAGSRIATVGPCQTRHLDVWYGEPGNGAAGSTYWDIELSNIGTHACTLDGYPGLVALSVNGPPLGSAAAHTSGTTPHLVTLAAKGGTAHVILRSVNPGFLEPACHAGTAGVLRFTPPGQHASVLIPLQIGVCKNHGPIFMYVWPVAAGVGIPGYTPI